MNILEALLGLILGVLCLMAAALVLIAFPVFQANLRGKLPERRAKNVAKMYALMAFSIVGAIVLFVDSAVLLQESASNEEWNWIPFAVLILILAAWGVVCFGIYKISFRILKEKPTDKIEADKNE